MAGDSETIKTTLTMRRAVWNAARAKALSTNQRVGDYLETLVLRDTGGSGHAQPDGRGREVGA